MYQRAWSIALPLLALSILAAAPGKPAAPAQPPWVFVESLTEEPDSDILVVRLRATEMQEYRFVPSKDGFESLVRLDFKSKIVPGPDAAAVEALSPTEEDGEAATRVKIGGVDRRLREKGSMVTVRAVLFFEKSHGGGLAPDDDVRTFKRDGKGNWSLVP